MDEGLILQRGNYKKLLSYQKSDVIFQLTYYFFATPICSVQTVRWIKPTLTANGKMGRQNSQLCVK